MDDYSNWLYKSCENDFFLGVFKLSLSRYRRMLPTTDWFAYTLIINVKRNIPLSLR